MGQQAYVIKRMPPPVMPGSSGSTPKSPGPGGKGPKAGPPDGKGPRAARAPRADPATTAAARAGGGSALDAVGPSPQQPPAARWARPPAPAGAPRPPARAPPRAAGRPAAARTSARAAGASLRAADAPPQTPQLRRNRTRDRSRHPADPADAGDGGDLLVREGDIAGDYLERLLDIADVDGDIDMDVEGDRAVVAVVGEGSTPWSAPTARCSRRCRSSPGWPSCSRPASAAA
jgi:hypothetical protein